MMPFRRSFSTSASGRRTIAVLVLAIPLALLYAWWRGSQVIRYDVGAHFRDIDSRWVVSLELSDSSPPDAARHQYVTSDPEIVRPCFAAVQSAWQTYHDGHVPISRIDFRVLEPGKPLRSKSLILNTAMAEQDYGAEVARCVADIKRRGTQEW